MSFFSSSSDSRGYERSCLSVVVPVYNEEARIAENLTRLHEHLMSSMAEAAWELIVVDDGSRDRTAQAVADFAKGYDNVIVLSHAVNRGLGAALKTGLDRARGACIVTLDADLSYEPSVVNRLNEEWQRSRASLVLASPYMVGGRTSNVPATRLFMSVWANRLLSLASGGRIKTFTGMVRAYDRAFLRTLAWPQSGNANVEVLLSARRAGAAVVEIPAELAWPSDRGAPRLSRSRAAHEVLSVLRYSIHFAFARMKE
jgi:glycosyltransferase involved in cell wall biosynthesis